MMDIKNLQTTEENMPLISISPDKKQIVILTKDGWAASLVEGVWYSKILYDVYEMNELFLVEDPQEIEDIVQSAQTDLSLSDPEPPGVRLESLVEPLRNLLHVHDNEPDSQIRVDESLKEFWLETKREMARLSLHRYALRPEWVALFWQTLIAGNLNSYPEAKQKASDVARSLYLVCIQ